MKFNHDKFITACGNFNESQRQGMEFLIASFEADAAMADIRWISYSLATIGRECAGTWQPIAENGKGTGRSYGEPDSITGLVYYGRGYVQLTWKTNYAAMSKATGMDLVGNPDLALKPTTAYRIMSYGMRNGSFSGVGLSHYINDQKCDYVNARRVINGTDHAQEIANAAAWFEATLQTCLLT